MHAAATLQSTGATLALALGAAKLVRWWLLSRRAASLSMASSQGHGAPSMPGDGECPPAF
ncbi:hypothetical protein HaLaN_27001 [Haematococcus lacustris]|uniref:Uncharacterized protein n=1 Tax=Haematococcus lacustris TaxID=44745 RepID=A0A6A0A7B3_HAELA|nr:hypothetical protein HaLaN_27001 [Haematococcus lacustris]